MQKTQKRRNKSTKGPSLKSSGLKIAGVNTSHCIKARIWNKIAVLSDHVALSKEASNLSLEARLFLTDSKLPKV